MRKILFAGVVNTLLLAGCATPGLRFEFVQPPILMGTQNAVVQSTSGTVSTKPVTTVHGPLGAHEIFVEPTNNPVVLGAPRAVTSRPPLAMPAADCNLEDVCRRLAEIERKLTLPPAK